MGDEGEKIKVLPLSTRTCYCEHCPDSKKKETHSMTLQEYKNNGFFIKDCPNEVISRGRKALYLAKRILT